MTIRPSTLDDVEQIVNIWFDSAEHHAALNPERYHVPSRESILERYGSAAQYPQGISERATLVAESAAGVVGFVDLWMDTPFDPMHQPMRYGFIADLAVSKLERSSGIGEQLMRAAEEWARAHDARFVVLEANILNPRAGAFYRRIGYRPATTTFLRWL